MSSPAPANGHRTPFSLLCLGALGVVFGDIGTSPLYTLKECLRASGAHPGAPEVYGVLSLIFWSLTVVVTVKYLGFIMKADNKGEGGIFALLALVKKRRRGAAISGVTVLAVVGAALLYGDGVITPAISVLSAIEGLEVARPSLAPAVVPITCAILFALFFIQRHGTHAIGQLFGPIMFVWFATIGALGAYHIVKHPAVLQALSPHWGARYFVDHGLVGTLILGSVVLAVTGGEALYADMGHFGRRPIRAVWLGFVMPALVLAYFGQGAMWLANPTAANPFFAMAPSGAPKLALVVLSSAATVIASQALISGVFSMTRQAMLLGYFPRVTVQHTSHDTEGQIYIPQLNWILAAACLILVLGFGSSDRLAAAYGIAVTGTMAITSILYYLVTQRTWGWSRAKAIPVLVVFLTYDLAFFGANLVKFVDGGYVPILVGAAFVTVMLIWSRGRSLLAQRFARFPKVEAALAKLDQQLLARVPGTGVFLASATEHMPPCLMRIIERSRTLNEHVVLLTVHHEDVPTVDADQRVEHTDLGHGFHRVIIHAGFMEQPAIHDLLVEVAAEHQLPFGKSDVTYYLGRETLLSTDAGRMGHVTETIYSFLQRNAVAADRTFGIPPDQVIEVGTQIDL